MVAEAVFKINPEILKAFNKDYPEIKVTTAGGHGSELGARILAERRAGKYLVDLYAGGPTTPYRALYLSKALDPIAPLLLLPEVTDVSKWFTGKHVYADPEDRYLFFSEPIRELIKAGNLAQPYDLTRIVAPDLRVEALKRAGM